MAIITAITIAGTNVATFANNVTTKRDPRVQRRAHTRLTKGITMRTRLRTSNSITISDIDAEMESVTMISEMDKE